jgi:uncharacterized protein (TIGR00369 family)
VSESKEVFYQALLAHINHPGEFSSYNNIHITRVSEHYAEGELTVTPESLNYIGVVHGGCLAALADTVAGVAVCSTGMGCVTLNYGLNFLRAATGTKIKCVAQPEKTGKTICVYKISLTDDQEQLVAIGEFTFFITKPLVLPDRSL